MIALSKIRIDGGTQSRIAMDQAVLAEYAELYKAGVQMPAVTVFYDGSTYWLADGFHRYFAAKQAGLAEIFEEITPGTRRDAVLYSLGANARHGLRRCNADKRKAVQTLLDDPEWNKWSSREVAKQCGVSHTFVDGIRESHLATLPDKKYLPSPRTVTRNGTTYKQNTLNIGSRLAQSPAAASAEDEQYNLPEVSELAGLREHTAEQGKAIKELIADNESMAKVFDANDHVAAAMAEVKQFREMNRVLEERIRGLMNEKNEAIRAATRWKRIAEKAEEALKGFGYAG